MFHDDLRLLNIPAAGCRSACAYTLTGLLNGTTYTLHLTAVNAAGESPTASATAKPHP